MRNDFFLVLKMSLISILFMYALALYKFKFDFSKVSLLVTLKWFPLILVLLLFCFYLSKNMKNK
ncbi:UDP-diphosphatase [Haemophilus haemolyticus]|nr:hypothetical protein A8M50_04395 [Haemophilus haemolyticus]TPH06550.1 UDP-diphosphatase [Haemophilus haemolyticus]TPH27453.1 UDP-diphosphatase [Haemophilus haemolyticus]